MLDVGGDGRGSGCRRSRGDTWEEARGGHPRSRRCVLVMAEEEEVAVGILDFEAAGAVIAGLEGLEEGDMAGGEFCGEGVGVGEGVTGGLEGGFCHVIAAGTVRSFAWDVEYGGGIAGRGGAEELVWVGAGEEEVWDVGKEFGGEDEEGEGIGVFEHAIEALAVDVRGKGAG